MWPNVLNDIVCDFVRQWRGSTLNGLEHSVPGLVARAYHRVKCVRARSMTRSVAFFASRHSWPRKICINLLLAQNRADDPSTFRAPLVAIRSLRIHLAERRLMAT
jgi:hypothetical protein